MLQRVSQNYDLFNVVNNPLTNEASVTFFVLVVLAYRGRIVLSAAFEGTPHI